MSQERLPHVDTHTVTIPASAGAVWQAVLRTTGRFAEGRGSVLARVLGTDPPSGFAVVVEDPGRCLVLTGRHRFSVYELRFRVEPAAGRSTLLHAVTDAAFPGVLGRGYRAAVVGTGLHAVVTRRILASIDRASTSGTPEK